MPGREDLIKQNIARAETRAKVETASEQASTSGEKQTYSSHRSLLGGNLDVASALNSIKFVMEGPLGDGALRNSVAYIRYWSRPGSKTTAETASQTVDATQIDPGTDPQSELNRAITERYGIEREGAQIIEYTDDFSAAVVTENNGTATYISTEVLDTSNGRVVQTNVDSNTLVLDDDGNILEGFRETRTAKYNEQLSIDTTEQKQRQSALSSQVPKTKDSSNTQSTIVANSSQRADTQDTVQANNYRISGVGQLKPANPNGFVNIFSRVGRGVLGVPSGQIGYQGAAGPAQKGKAPLAKNGTLSKGMWQFLFNPSELEIEAGPEFKAAETWGVSDKANSGQPLNWSHNKNAQLKFNSVLLNGYVFGRKVEELEQGIFELFMARDGEGQAGPPILEFVWGKRVFGPCVIKEISIKERMWDEGEAVNAELSFTLEQIPEWTINDGYVDVARPGRIPMVYDVATPASDTPPGATPPGGSPEDKSSDQKSKNPQSQAQQQVDFTKCKRIQSDMDASEGVGNSIRSSIVSNSSLILFGSGWAQSFKSAFDKYNSLLGKYKSSPTYKQYFTNKHFNEKCLNPGGSIYGISADHAKEYKLAKTPQQKTDVDNKYKIFLYRCANNMGDLSEGNGSDGNGPLRAAYVAGGCNRFQSNPSSNEERL